MMMIHAKLLSFKNSQKTRPASNLMYQYLCVSVKIKDDHTRG